MVYFKYCDGGSFSGSNSTAEPVGNSTLHWRGKHILNGGITDMLQNRGLAQATEVVVSGCSAGGLAAFLHCDHFEQRIHAEGQKTAKVVCMPDSGLFRDYQGCTVPGLCSGPHYHDRLVWVFDYMNASSGVNDACVAAEQPISNCMFAEHTMKYIKTPTFPLQGEYDAWQVIADLGIAGKGMPRDPAQVALINEYGVNFTAVVKANLLNQPQHSIFLDSCFHHCGGWGDYHAGPDNITQPFAMKEWYEAMDSGVLAEPGTQKTWIQGKPYPCQECCGP
jgi:O-palmitoleoyl-L-serine hydrolase